MKKARKELQAGDRVFVGMDLHKKKGHVTARTADLGLFSGSIPGCWKALQRILGRCKGHQIYTVYETCYFGFWLHDHLVEHGAVCIVTPPSLIPRSMAIRLRPIAVTPASWLIWMQESFKFFGTVSFFRRTDC